MNISETAQQVSSAVSSQKGAALVASATATSGLAEIYDIIQGVTGFIGLVLGIVLTSVLIRKHLLEYRLLKAKLKDND